MSRPRLRNPDPVIGIDASRLSVSQRTGTEQYTYEVLKAMGRIAPDEAIRLYLNADSLPNEIDLPWETRAIPFPRLWTHVRLSREIAQHPPELLWVPAHVIPLIHPRSVVTIHDLGYIHVPKAHPAKQRKMLESTTRWSVRVASHVIAISETTKQDLIRHYDVSPAKISVAPHGVSERFTRPTDAEIAEVRVRLNLPEQFILGVGTIQPRKNYTGLARIIARMRAAGLPRKLVLAGKPGWMSDQVLDEIKRIDQHADVIVLGYVDDCDLPALYSAAEIVAFPSHYEGFGLPALEAMRCGTPVVVSNRGALPEVVGNAGLVVDPDDEVAFADELMMLASDSELRRIYSDRGREHAAAFTWERTAQLTLDVLRTQRTLA
ncbi:MAG: glycosyltransferase family 4 protein [Thermomicrobiales bacterium]